MMILAQAKFAEKKMTVMEASINQSLSYNEQTTQGSSLIKTSRGDTRDLKGKRKTDVTIFTSDFMKPWKQTIDSLYQPVLGQKSRYGNNTQLTNTLNKSQTISENTAVLKERLINTNNFVDQSKCDMISNLSPRTNTFSMTSGYISTGTEDFPGNKIDRAAARSIQSGVSKQQRQNTYMNPTKASRMRGSYPIR